MTAPNNLAASVMARLLALAERRDESFNLLMVRFGVERLLYRPSQSRHADKFWLKGQCCLLCGTSKLASKPR